MDLLQRLALSKTFLRSQSLLLALSGGVDSMVLFDLLKKARIPFSVAHVDHGWRESSHLEAISLKKMCEREGIPFYLLQLKEKWTFNLEEQARAARYAFFKSLCDEHLFSGVLVAHQADDRAETVLKRVLEGLL